MKPIPLFEEFVNIYESGQKPGELEIGNIDTATAVSYIAGRFSDVGLDIYELIPNVERNVSRIQALSKFGSTLRKDMPVINDTDVDNFKRHMEDGIIDIRNPFAPTTNKRKPFPTGLSGTAAADFLTRGLRDGQMIDDKIEISDKKVKIGDLKPIQKQIYLDKAVDMMLFNGGDIKRFKKWLESDTTLITSEDDFTIDGHHRWLAGNIVDPEIKVNSVAVGLDIKDLLPMALAYGDAIGNKRNA